MDHGIQGYYYYCMDTIRPTHTVGRRHRRDSYYLPGEGNLKIICCNMIALSWKGKGQLDHTSGQLKYMR